MVKHRYWFLAPANEGADGELPAAEVVLSEPWWPEAVKGSHKKANEYVEPPMIFSTQAAAETEMREIESAEPDDHLRLIDKHGEKLVNLALDNTAPLRIFAIERESLADKLGDAEFLCVLVDGQLKLREDFAKELLSDA